MRAALMLTVMLGTAAAAPLEIGLMNSVPVGGKPSLTLVAHGAIRGVQVALSRTEDSAQFSLKQAAMKNGQKVTLSFGDGKGGHWHWTGKLTATLGDGTSFNSDLTFETVTVGELKVTYRRDRLDLDAHTLEFQLSRPAGSAELQVFGEDGTLIGDGAAKFSREPAGTWLRVTWTPKSGADVFRLELRAVDVDGLATRVKLLPWSIYVQHEEVRFPTGSAEIPASETAKLDASYTKIVEAVERARKADPKLPVRVFIAGHTDTVGSADDNRKLSLARAKAIATWFRDRGLPLPLSYAGFGEDALKVKTPDNTDEPRNRRADYILGVEEPVVARGVSGSWHPL